MAYKGFYFQGHLSICSIFTH